MARFNSQVFNLAKKFLEYKEDPIRFAEECVMIPTPGGDKLVKLYEPQKKIIKDFFKNHYLILLKSRQTGFSTTSQILVAYISTFYENCVSGVISRDAKESSDFCRKVEDMIDKLPSWIRPKYKTKSVQSYILDNGCQLWSSAISPANPGAVFRGKSIVLLILDEAAFTLHLEEAYTAMAMSLSKAQMDAEKNDIPFGTMMLSTPNKKQGPGNFFYSNWVSAINNDSIFNPHKIHWTEIPDFVNNPEWYKTQCRILGNNKEKIAQELELKFIGSENNLFEASVQEKLQECTIKPLEVIKIGKREGEIWKFKEINKKKFYIIGVDTASGAGGTDYSAIEVYEYETMEQVLEFKGKLPVKKFAEIVKLVAKLVPNNIIVVENNSYGNQVVEEISFDENDSYNLFGTMNESKKKFIPGLNTNTKTRPLILDALYKYITDDPSIIRSERLSFEILNLVDRSNKVEADIGGNDDLALAFGFICYLRYYCSDILGNTDDITDDNEFINGDDIYNTIHDMSSKENRLKSTYQTSEFDVFKRELDKYISNDTEGGVIDILSIINP